MKEIRKIINVLSPDHCEKNNKNDVFDSNSESGFHQRVGAMLAPGHNNEVCWLKSCVSIQPEQICRKAMIDKKCIDLMQWRSANEEDLCQWQCRECSEQRSIRENLILTKANCSINIAIKILLGWCKGYDIETVANMLSIQNSVVGELYIEAANVAEKCMRSNVTDWQLGGPGVVVIIDTYPEGCTNTNHIRTGRPILCISEVKSIPQKYWLETLNHFQVNNIEQIADLKEDILRIVRTLVHPGSILITPFKSLLCSYSDFDCLRTLYPTIVNTRDLARHDNIKQTLFSNMETIWKSVLDICEVAQFCNDSLIQQFIVSHMWRRRYAEESFEVLLYGLSLMQ